MVAGAVNPHEHSVHAHPSQETYVKIAIMLAIITGIEVAIYYIPLFASILVPTLIVLSAIKFVTVVGYFMHLKFDNHMLTFAFTAAMVVSIIMFIGLWVVMHFNQVTQFIGNMSLNP